MTDVQHNFRLSLTQSARFCPALCVVRSLGEQCFNVLVHSCRLLCDEVPCSSSQQFAARPYGTAN